MCIKNLQVGHRVPDLPSHTASPDCSEGRPHASCNSGQRQLNFSKCVAGSHFLTALSFLPGFLLQKTWSPSSCPLPTSSIVGQIVKLKHGPYYIPLLLGTFHLTLSDNQCPPQYYQAPVRLLVD